RNGSLLAAPFDAGRLALTGMEAPVVEGVVNLIDDGADYSVSDTGMLVYMGGTGAASKTSMNWADRKGATVAISDNQSWGTGRLSPDGTRIANGIHAGKGEDIWTYEVERHTRLRLTYEGVNQNPIWTTDGKSVTFSANNEGKHGISQVPSDASKKPEMLLE